MVSSDQFGLLKTFGGGSYYNNKNYQYFIDVFAKLQ